MRLVADYGAPACQTELTAALLAAQRHLHSLGITSFQDACVGDAGEISMSDTFATATERRHRPAADLPGHRRTLVGPVPRHAPARNAANAQGDRRRQYGYFRATSVKLMLDGVCETFTAAMGAPYLDGHGHAAGHAGSLFIEPDELSEAAGKLADLGFQMHFHAIGDRAVKAALDALAALPEAQRISGRHHIAHLQFINPADLDRFAKLGVTGNFQPLWACKDEQNDMLTIPFVGLERASWQYRIGSLLRLGTQIAFGSDWPVSSADPLQELHVAVNRLLSARLAPPGLGRDDDRAAAARRGDRSGRCDRRLHQGRRLREPRGGRGGHARAWQGR